MIVVVVVVEREMNPWEAKFEEKVTPSSSGTAPETWWIWRIDIAFHPISCSILPSPYQPWCFSSISWAQNSK